MAKREARKNRFFVRRNESTGHQAGAVLFRRFALRRLVDRGRLGALWHAYDNFSHTDVVLRFFPKDICSDRRWFKYVETTAAITHPHIVQTFGVFQADGDIALVSEYVDGLSIADIQTQRSFRAFDPQEVIGFLTQICDALEYLHDRGIIHRNLTPSNIIVGRQGSLKLLDFGLTDLVKQSLNQSPEPRNYENEISEFITSPLQLNGKVEEDGTFAFMSPQQLNGESPRVADDIYLFGATLFQLLTGTPPLVGDDLPFDVDRRPAPLITARRKELGLRHDDIPEHWVLLVSRCLSKDIETRPSTIRQVKEILRLKDVRSTMNRMHCTARSSDRLSESILTVSRPTIKSVPVGLNRSAQRKRIKVIGGCFASGSIFAVWQLAGTVSGFTLFLGCACLAYECFITLKLQK